LVVWNLADGDPANIREAEPKSLVAATERKKDEIEFYLYTDDILM